MTDGSDALLNLDVENQEHVGGMSDVDDEGGIHVLGVAEDDTEKAVEKDEENMMEAAEVDVHSPASVSKSLSIHCSLSRPSSCSHDHVSQVDADGIPNHYQEVRHEDRNMVKSPLPHETMDLLQLPDSFDWRNVNGKSYTSVPR